MKIQPCLSVRMDRIERMLLVLIAMITEVDESPDGGAQFRQDVTDIKDELE